MPSAVSTDLLSSSMYVRAWDHDPGSTSAVITSPDGGTTKRTLDMRDYDAVLVAVTPKVLAGAGATLLEIVASDSSDMSTNLTVVKTSSTIAPDAVDDWYPIECTEGELAQLSSSGGISPGLRYVAGRVTCANAGDEVTVVYMARPKRPTAGITAASIS